MKDHLFYIIGFSIVVAIFIILFTASEKLLGINNVIIIGVSAIIAHSIMNNVHK